MGLLHGNTYLETIEAELKKTRKHLIIFSAYIKREALDELSKSIADAVSVTVVVRWNKIDILSGASDLDIFELCNTRGWSLRIDLSLHGKLYLLDNTKIILGSSNLTKRGLGLVKHSNLEFGTMIDASLIDSSKLADIANNSTIVDEKLFFLLKKEIQLGYQESNTVEWSDMILEQLNETVTHLWVDDCLFATPSELKNLNLNQDNQAHDFELLTLDIDRISPDYLQSEFMASIIGRWLKETVKNNQGINFGGLSSLLHNSLLNDPKPYRQDVKKLVATLIEWAEFCPDVYSITRYRHTLSISLKCIDKINE